MTTINIDADERNARWIGTLSKRRTGGADEASFAVRTETDYLIDGDEPDKASVSLIPADPEDWALDGAEDPKALHVTLKFMGPAEDFDEEARDRVDAVVAELVEGAGSFLAEITEIRELGPKKAQAVCLSNEALDDFRERLVHELGGLGIEIPADTYPNFLPHMTLAYGPVEDDLDDYVGDLVTFDRVRVSWGDRYTDFAL